METFWTFEHGGKRFDLECKTRKECEEYVDNWFSERFDDEDPPMRNGETREDEGEIIEFRFDEQTGEQVDISREKYALHYEYYHGDYAEHNTHWGL